MNETVTLQTLLIAGAPFGVLLLITLFTSVLGGGFEAAGRRLRGQPSRLAELERRIATVEAALKRTRSSELPLEIEAERLAREIQEMQAGRRDTKELSLPEPRTMSPASGPDTAPGVPGDEPAAPASAAIEETEQYAEASLLIDLPPEPDESEEDRIAREQLEAEERERLERIAAEEARIREESERRDRERLEAEARLRREEQEERKRVEREQRAEEERRERERLEAEAKQREEAERRERERLAAEAKQREEAERRERERLAAEAKQREEAERRERERLAAEAKQREEAERRERERLEAEARKREEEARRERERLEAEAKKRHEEEQRRKAEEFRRRVADATPKIVMTAGGSNREGATINIEVSNNITPKRAELVVLTTSWAPTPTPATFERQRKDGLFEEYWPKHGRQGAAPEWSTYQDASGRVFECPEGPPTNDQAWIVISYERTVGGPAATWQRFEVSGAGALWYIRQPIGDPIVVEAQRTEDSEAAA